MGAYPVFVDGLVVGRTEGHKLVGDDPVEVSVFDLLVVLVLVEVELLVVEPAQLDGVVESAEAI